MDTINYFAADAAPFHLSPLLITKIMQLCCKPVQRIRPHEGQILCR